MKLTVNILGEFIQTLSLSGEVVSSIDYGTNTLLLMEKTFHARKKMKLNVDGVDYEISKVVNNESIEVVGSIATPSTYTVPNPFYFHGTPILTNAHINSAKDKDKYPMIYLYEILKEKEKRENSRIVKESDLRLFFLDNANFGEWTTDDHYSKRLLGLNNLVDEFVEAARAYNCCFYLYDTDFTRINHVNWGTWRNNAGHEMKLFDDELTGVELTFTLPLKNCK